MYEINLVGGVSGRIQQAADMNNTKAFYSGLRAEYDPEKKGSTQLTAADGETLLHEKEDILNRFAGHFNQLLNVPRTLGVEADEELERRNEISELEEEPMFEELLSAIKTTSEGISPGPDGMPAEVWKNSGAELLSRVHELILQIWRSEDVPQDWKDTNMVPIFKKGNRKDCGNYCGFSLL